MILPKIFKLCSFFLLSTSVLKSNFTLRYLVLQLYLVIKASIFVPTLVGSFEFRYQLCGLHASIFREGPGNDLQGFGKFVDGILFKACTSLTENRKQESVNGLSAIQVHTVKTLQSQHPNLSLRRRGARHLLVGV